MTNPIFIFIHLVLNVVNSAGYFGIFLGMAIESSFIPFPSEIILIPAGALISTGKLNFLPVFLAALFGSIAGAVFNYLIAFYLGRKTTEYVVDKYGKMFFISKKDIEKSDEYFKKHGEITIFVGRLIPIIRQLISLPAGFSKMNFNKFLIYSSLGAGLWSLFLIYLGYFFGEHSQFILDHFGAMNFILVTISVVIILIYAFVKKKI